MADYEEAIVQDKCVHAPLEEQCKNALKHYQGISRIAMHSSSLIEIAITDYPRLKAIEELAGALIEIDYQGHADFGEQCPFCKKTYRFDYRNCQNPECPAVKLRTLLEPEDDDG